MSQKEINHLLRVLPSYYEHMDTIPECTIARIFGVFTVRIDKFEPIHVMIMQNTMPNIPDTEMSYVFDMKGSSINREVLKHKSAADLRKQESTGGTVLKDLDYCRLLELKKFLKLEQGTIHRIHKNLTMDVDFLRSSRFMDYSLLLCIRRVTNAEQKVRKTATILSLNNDANCI